MIPPVGFAIAALTVMLWILWSDSIRSRRASQAMYALRVATYLVVTGVLILNRVRYPQYFSGGATLACGRDGASTPSRASVVSAFVLRSIFNTLCFG